MDQHRTTDGSGEGSPRASQSIPPVLLYVKDGRVDIIVANLPVQILEQVPVLVLDGDIWEQGRPTDYWPAILTPEEFGQEHPEALALALEYLPELGETKEHEAGAG